MQIIILSMHRSGSSVLARLLNMMGAYLGPEHQIANKAPDNPKGFWERKDVVRLNDLILQAGGSEWNDVWNFNWQQITTEQKHTFHSKIERLITGLDANRPWLIKDPRLCKCTSSNRIDVEIKSKFIKNKLQ